MLLAALLVPSGVLLVTPVAGAATTRASSGSTVGTVASVDAGAHTFTVRTPAGSKVTVKVTAATAFKDSLVHAPSFADVKVGVSVAVIGATAHGVDTAAIVIIGGTGGSGPNGGNPSGPGFPGGPGGFRPGLVGTVTAVDAKKDTFTLKTANGSKVTVKVTKSTTFRDRAKAKAGLSDVKVGGEVAVVATKVKGVEQASSVILGLGSFRPGGFRPGLVGKVTAVDAKKDTFTLKTANGSKVTVKVTKSTTFRDRAKAKAGLSDVKVGGEVAVVATKVKGVEQASRVLIGFAFGTFAPPSGT